MEDNKEVTPEVKEEVTSEVQPDRPEENFKAELDRKNREIERLRMLAMQRQEQPKQRDPNDLKTWGDHELKAIVHSNDPSVMPYKDQANEILLDRKVDARLARQAETNKRVSAELELKQKFPDAADPTSELSSKIDELTSKYDLDKSPAGRLVAAKLAASELTQGKTSSDARKAKEEKDRVAGVKGQLVDGDRPKPTETSNKTLEEKALKEKFLSEKPDGFEAVSKWLDGSGLRERFNKKWGA